MWPVASPFLLLVSTLLLPPTRVPDRVLQAECAVSVHATNFPLNGNKVAALVGHDVALQAELEESGRDSLQLLADFCVSHFYLRKIGLLLMF